MLQNNYLWQVKNVAGPSISHEEFDIEGSDIGSDDSVKDPDYNPVLQSDSSSDEFSGLEDGDKFMNRSDGAVTEQPDAHEQKSKDRPTEKVGHLSRWRKKNVENWSKNVRKRKRNFGESYLSSSGKKIPARHPQPVDCSKCR